MMNCKLVAPSLAAALASFATVQADAAPYNYSYDDADNLTTATGTAMSWSGASYNNVNQPGTLGSNSYSYDANGNLISDGVRSYKWDAENRLISIDHPGNLHTTFSYDGLGRRIAITTTNGTTTRYLWSGSRLVQARDASNNVSRRYYDEGEVVVASNTRLAYAIDRMGSVRDVVDVADGSRTFAADYEPYGAVSQSSGAIPTDFRYAGLFTLTDNNQTLYLANYRAYDPSISRWLNRDPIQETAGINLYAYTNGDPTNAVDPMGLDGGLPTPALMPYNATTIGPFTLLTFGNGTMVVGAPLYPGVTGSVGLSSPTLGLRYGASGAAGPGGQANVGASYNYLTGDVTSSCRVGLGGGAELGGVGIASYTGVEQRKENGNIGTPATCCRRIGNACCRAVDSAADVIGDFIGSGNKIPNHSVGSSQDPYPQGPGFITRLVSGYSNWNYWLWP
jgi:RHS repeat-associated protein